MGVSLMRFQPGQSGNPAGRPPGSRNKKTELAEDVLAVAAQETAMRIVARAQCGDKAAMRLVMERTVPTGTDRPLELKLPTVEGAEDLIAAAGVVLKALAAATFPRARPCACSRWSSGSAASPIAPSR